MAYDEIRGPGEVVGVPFVDGSPWSYQNGNRVHDNFEDHEDRIAALEVTPGATKGPTIGIVIDGGGSVIAPGVKGFVRVPIACTITKVTVLSIDAAATSGSIVVDVWKDIFANYPPTNADSITASAPPTLSSASKSEDSTLSGWNLSILAGDVIGFNVDSATTVTRVLVEIETEL